ncbi:MAG TPA: biopolymer transporter ExbD [Burkholderiales bacterium]|nr:biopolymer transporter ExbD [Burkholderiales bacterium]
MNFRPTPDEEPEINLIPLIDVLLMTLIFLIVTTSFSSQALLQVQLPEASVEPAPAPDALRIVIDARGQYYINDRQLLSNSVELLRSTVLREIGANKERLLIIQADAKTPHEAVVRVMDVAGRLGLTRLTFATQKPAPDSGS